MRPTLWILAAGAFGCRSEGGLGVAGQVWGEPNPQEVETPVQVDRVVQVTIPQVDVLFVVDNSCSMEEEQVLLGSNFPDFLAWFLGSGLDYHIGVISTDMNDPLQSGKLRSVGDRRWIDADTQNPEGLFTTYVQMGTTGHWDEKGRAAAYTAIELQRDEANLGFVRPDAGMHITVVSDENDASGESPVSRDEFVEYLRTLRWSRRLVSFSSIVGPLTGCPYIGDPGTEYMDVTAQVGGVVWPICADDWSAMLEELGFLAVGLQREFFLSRLPVPGTIEVSVERPGTVIGFEPADWAWSAERNSVTFHDFVPEPLDTVVIRYQVLAGQQEDGAPSTGTPAG